MTQTKTSNTSQLINVAIPVFCIASLLYNTEALQIIGYIFLILAVVVFFLASHSLKRMKVNKTMFYLIIAYISFIYSIGLIKNISFRGIEVFVCFFISITILICFSTINIKVIKTRIIKLFFIFESFFLFLPFILRRGFNPVDGGYMSFFTTTTFLGIFSCIQIELCLLLYNVKGQKIWLVFVPFFLILLWLSMVRTVYIGIIIVFLSFFLRNRFVLRSTSILSFIKWLLFFSIVLIVYLYPKLESFQWYEVLAAFVYASTGKILMSGRNEVWAEGLDYISKNPFEGYGLDTLAMNMSLHNSYLQLLLESGIWGILGIFILINYILNKISKSKRKSNNLFFIFSLVNLLMCTTEVMLLHGQMVLQVLIWSILGLGLNNYSDKKLVCDVKNNQYEGKQLTNSK